MLYDSEATQCKRCGRRFNQDDIAAHLDWHFVQNEVAYYFLLMCRVIWPVVGI